MLTVETRLSDNMGDVNGMNFKSLSNKNATHHHSLAKLEPKDPAALLA
jgi:hypothetical protein